MASVVVAAESATLVDDMMHSLLTDLLRQGGLVAGLVVNRQVDTIVTHGLAGELGLLGCIVTLQVCRLLADAIGR
jgi:hypothetical protein